MPENILEANLNSAVVRLDLDLSLIDKRFFCLLFSLQFIRTQIDFIGKGAAQNNLNNEEISSIQIPLFPLKLQNQLVEKYNQTYNIKKEKEAQAKVLLASIDEYLLKELGIILPDKQESSLKNRVFLRNISEVSGERFDAGFYSSQRIVIEGGSFENLKLKDIAIIQKGQSITKETIIHGDYPVIAGGQSSPYSHNQYNFLGNSITVSASGAYAGYVWYHNYPIFASDCCLVKSKNEKTINTLFLFEILKLKQQEIYCLQQGAAQPHIYASDLSELMMPLPPLEIQERIVNHVQSIRDRAKILENEAKDILEQAKAEIERMILGE